MFLEGVQYKIVLKGDVWFDETFIKVRSYDVQLKPDGKEYRGLSFNQICIGIAMDDTNIIVKIEGKGKTSSRRTVAPFANHIEPGSVLIHDFEKSHNALVDKLNLKNKARAFNKIKSLPDAKNPLNPINQVCRLLKIFLRSHSGFLREDLQEYLNIFSIIMNPPENKYQKIKKY